MKINEIISDWYKISQRDLPWRKTKDPYSIWLSEIILQQTRVSQGMAYYFRFLKRFPDVRSLAEADEQEVMKLWQGLGYYSRARNLLKAARQVVTEFEGKFPVYSQTLKKLKGVGEYTAAAIASIAYNEPVALVDGNVERVISRLFLVREPVNSSEGRKLIREFADVLLDASNPGNHNQAMMEFGALQCIPKNPACKICPLEYKCMANNANMVSELPVKIKKVAVRTRYFTYLLIYKNGCIFIKKREENDIWKQLYDFPLIEHNKRVKTEELLSLIEEFTGLGEGELRIHKISEPIKHQLTHRSIIARFVHAEILKKDFSGKQNWITVTLEQIGEYPLPRLIDRYLETIA